MRSAPVKMPGRLPLEKLRPPERDEQILIAVSGGLDSMVLLHALATLSAAHHWKLAVVHFNHRLRGRASDADEDFVRKTAAAMKLPFIAGRANVKEIAKEQKLSVEMAARKLRHKFFAETARRRGIKTVALAHHADDQVELFFLRLFRGTGGGGLAGMKWRSSSPADGKVSLIRPLLNASRAELEQYGVENGIRYRRDATNSSLDFLRNRIRHELLPLLRKDYQRGLNKTILRFMDISGVESDFVGGVAQAWVCKYLRSDTGKDLFVSPAAIRKDFEKLPVAVQRQVLRLQLASLEVATDFDLIESIRRLPGEQIAANANCFVLRDEKGRVSRREHRTLEFDDHKLAVKLGKPAQIVFEGMTLRWRFSGRGKENSHARQSAATSGMEWFDAAKAGEEMIVRHWRAGDRFQPMGFKSRAKLQDLFTSAKIPRERRHKLIVAETNGEIFWVEGLRISENFKLTPQTQRYLIWIWRR